MQAAGLQKTSLIDFPGKVCCVVFLTGCNFTCPYCHNPALALGRYPTRIPMAELVGFLARRKSLLDGVVITGGEPTLWAELPELCRSVHRLDLAVKLDTNGSRPEVLEALVHSGLVDYIAMDLKTVPHEYGPPLCPADTGPAINRSIQVIMNSGVDYEFRTTCVPPFVDATRMARMASTIKGARRFILQKFKPAMVLDPGYFEKGWTGFSAEQMADLRRLAAAMVQSCSIR
jgi:pyruvate formate lyase activating enzyme